MAEPILEIDRLGISFFTRAGEIPAVMDFSCKVMPGEAMGLVGESGCGKSTVALAVMRDLPGAGRITMGSIRFDGRDMASLTGQELRAIRGSRIAMVYQEPMASLNPTMLIGRQLMEVPLIHDKVATEEARARALDMVKAVRLPDPERIMRAYPHQLSGGQQQRVVIAMALLSNPRLLILDEPTTALDVTVEAGIVALVKDLTRRSGASSLFISHNLGLILETCDSVTVMYSGEAVETGRVRDVFGAARHPYTQGLFRSMPLPATNKNDNPLVPIPGQLPLPHERPNGCNFGPRCPHFVAGLCDKAEAPMFEVAGSGGHQSRCFRIEAIDWSASAGKADLFRPVTIGPEVLEVDRLKKHYRVAASALFSGGETRAVKAVEDVSFAAREAEVLAIVGELGCGKSTLAKVLLGLETATEGLVVFDHEAIQNRPVERRPVETIASIQMIFQNPFDTLNPSYSVGSQNSPDAAKVPGGQERRRAARDDAPAARSREAAARLRPPRAAAIVRRAETAHRRRARLRRTAAGDHRRRADVGARRLGAGGDQRTPDEPAARIEDDDGVHQPRPVGGALSRRSGRRDVSRPCRRDGRDGTDFFAAVPSVHGSAAVGDPDRRRDREEAPRRARGRDSLRALAARGMPVSELAVAIRVRFRGAYASASSRRPASWPTDTPSNAICPSGTSSGWSRCSRDEAFRWLWRAGTNGFKLIARTDFRGGLRGPCLWLPPQA